MGEPHGKVKQLGRLVFYAILSAFSAAAIGSDMG